MFLHDPETISLIKNLDLTALRQKVTANNLANLNTPNFKRAYVSCGEELNKKGKGKALKVTNPRHFGPTPGGNEPEILTEYHTSRRVDGNNVDIDQEMLELVTNQLRYNTLVQQISERYAQWRYIINEGRR